ncbi:MAG: hypothetical protein JXA15_12660 [Spirochaetales bacterium]|nr:hypothetical protein [Spirochaetales bacterium]
MRRVLPSGLAFAFSSLLALVACSCLPELVTAAFEPGDLDPPGLVSWDVVEGGALVLRFDEAVGAAPADFAFEPGRVVASVETGHDGRTVTARPEGCFEPGAACSISGSVADASGNTVRFVLPFTGWNPRLPSLALNELLTEASTTHKDAFELLVLSDGNLAGLAVGSGKLSDPSFVWRLPAAEVKAGDYVSLHLKLSGTGVEADELGEDLARSGGLDAEPTARDLWYPYDDGALPGSNGVAWLRSSPTGPVLDAVFWCERTSASDTAYDGFGTAALRDAVSELFLAGAWLVAGEAPAPEDGVWSAAVTATRTLARRIDRADSDRREDWYVTVTSGESLGLPNLAPAHVP